MARKPACDRRGAQPAPRQEEPEDNGPQLTSVIPDELKALPVYALFTELAALPPSELPTAFMGLANIPASEQEKIPGLPHCFLAVDVTHRFATNEVHNPIALPLCTWWFRDRGATDNLVPAQFSSPLVYLGPGHNRDRDEPTALFAALSLTTDNTGLQAEHHAFNYAELLENLSYAQSPTDARTMAKGLAEMHTAARAANVTSAHLQ